MAVLRESVDTITKPLEYRSVRLSKVRRLLHRKGVDVPYSTLHRFAVAELGFGRRGPTIPVVDGKPGEELNSILDSCDGELARLRYQYSKLGQWLDNLSDDIVDNLFLVAVGYGIGGVWQWLGLAAAGGRLLVSIVTYVSVYLRTGTGNIFAFRWWFEGDDKTVDELYKPTSPMTWLRSFGRRDTFVFVWMIACLAGFPYWVIGHGLVIAAINVAILVLHFTVFRTHRRGAD